MINSTGNDTVREYGERAKSASYEIARSSSTLKNNVLYSAADLIHLHGQDLLSANAVDVDRAVRDGLSDTQLDRLKLDAG
ncbi:MAG: hypothetical protein M1280_05775, partial [Actinobacteria bacterium]|nr:hypothetical protein [Actinomycetota bacterium]